MVKVLANYVKQIDLIYLYIKNRFDTIKKGKKLSGFRIRDQQKTAQFIET